METLMKWVTQFKDDEEGLQTLEIMLIIAVIVVIALLFRDSIMGWVNDLINFGDENISDFQQE
ncbi:MULTISPECIES: Flp1 family type IVb pilin [Pontibacillus]|uniref:Flp1 family type IVb pilin n=1 Tax=Pontibacillus chungwhensis TaxID=265426 RepID=A0ABY8UXZ2_9BACI|nr:MULTISPECIES: Flp1 family type IVb pilin [Pontibacillus]MCD5323133.1 hypothetical protein [Pontibacillus sp. HN14]WIF96521.1 Flp1 family type IVb pilin [Pontibacillus chungwhensis]